LEINDFYWLDEIIDKLAVKHQVEPWEVEEVFQNLPRFRFRQKGTVRAKTFTPPWDKQTPADI
jgi:hypothetical protein